MPERTTLHIRQEAAGEGEHHIRLTLKRPRQPDLEGEATIEFALTAEEQADLRWYMEDYLQHAELAMLNYYKANYPREPYEQTANTPKVKCSVLMIHGLKDATLLPDGLNDQTPATRDNHLD
ncbi:MAG: hypothetical protein H8E44_47305 [Planctomycetes bacterium]|nr:hypothetical protein [Planctomycetota bacterium]MBL7040641.1 hypothetical protein [Pirellulaceae bacterium]